ncbi:unnamed protein product, partial [Timema podura]|nr:unnamed protein product [Timema podura]
LLQVERNVLDVSYHVSQYRTIINELREEINRLRSKMENRPRSGLHSAYLGEQIKGVRDQIVRTFRDQMKLRRQWKVRRVKVGVSFRRKLMDLDGQLLSLGAEAERQHLLISQWESKNNKLYKSSHRNTAQGWRPNTSPDLDLDR